MYAYVYMHMCIYIYIATHWNLECDFGNGALQKKHREFQKKQKSGVRYFFAPFFQSGRLSNEDLRMRGHWNVDHIIVLLSWFWLGIVKPPRFLNINKLRMPASILWFSSTTDVVFQVLPEFWTHFAFFGGVLVLSQVSSIYWKTVLPAF